MRTRPFLTALLLMVVASTARAARVLNHYDLQTLCAKAEVVIKAEIKEVSDVHTRDGNCAVANVEVVSVFKGSLEPRSMVRVAGIEPYKKGPGIDGGGDRFPRLARGDVVYLFLLPKGAREGYAMYDETDAAWKIIESGARLVQRGSVFDFREYFPPGPSNGPVPGFVAAMPQICPETWPQAFPRTWPPTVEQFEKVLNDQIHAPGKAAPATGPSTRP